MNRLDSWKAISLFMGRSLRTVQRWHERNRLPVHHIGGPKGPVFAYKEEIDQWFAGLAGESGPGPVRKVEASELDVLSSNELTCIADSMWEARSEANIHTIKDYYRRAIDKNSGNAEAYAGLANTMIYCALNGILDECQAYPNAIAALKQIPQENSDHAVTRCPEAWIEMVYRHNWRQARIGFEESLLKRPSSFALAGLTVLQIAQGNLPVAPNFTSKPWIGNPTVMSLSALQCWVSYLNGEHRETQRLVAEIKKIRRPGSMVTTIEALARTQDSTNSSATMECIQKAVGNFPKHHTLLGVLGNAYAAAGHATKAREIYASLRRSSEIEKQRNGYALALVCLGLKEKQESIYWLEKAYSGSEFWSLGFRFDPVLWPLKSDPRFQQLVSKVGHADQNEMESGTFVAVKTG